jgi:hypothetical protein
MTAEERGPARMTGASTPTLRVLSLGAGVQSTTLALMVAKGEIEAPDCAIFADTGWEPRAVYQHLNRLELAVPFPVYHVRAGNLRDDIMRSSSQRSGRIAAVPWFLKNPDGSAAMGRRQCTAHYKLEPLARKIRELLGATQRGRVQGFAEILIGISIDEASRMKPARVRYMRNRWPLIEHEMSRNDCLNWLARAGWNAPKSSCIGCPFHNNGQWRDLRDNDPEAWKDAVALDRMIRKGGHARGIRGEQYMHRSLVPLDEVDLRTAEDRGQLNLFNNECEGMCGV